MELVMFKAVQASFAAGVAVGTVVGGQWANMKCGAASAGPASAHYLSMQERALLKFHNENEMLRKKVVKLESARAN